MKKLVYGNYYHVFNRGNNKQNIFVDNQDYKHFFDLMTIYLLSLADIYAYVAMRNHFHFAVRIKDEHEIGYFDPKYSESDDLERKWRVHFPKSEAERIQGGFKKKPNPDSMFQHFCSAYAKGFNTKYKQSGTIFEHSFEAKLVSNEYYLKRLILYIHYNPIKHGFCDFQSDYPWSSYLSLVSVKPTKLSRENVLGYFNSQSEFIALHKTNDDFNDIEDLFME